MTIDELAQTIRSINGFGSMGAGELAEHLHPLIATRLQSLDAENARYKSALEEILECSPQRVLNLKAKVGDPSATGYNFHAIARNALKED